MERPGLRSPPRGLGLVKLDSVISIRIEGVGAKGTRVARISPAKLTEDRGT